MFTLRPDERTWSTPPKPMSYAQPSPPMIQTPLRTRSPASASRCRASAAIGPVDRAQRVAQAVDPLALELDLASVVLGCVEDLADELVAELGSEPRQQLSGMIGLGVEREAHARVRTPRCPRTASCSRPGRGPSALTVHGVVGRLAP